MIVTIPNYEEIFSEEENFEEALDFTKKIIDKLTDDQKIQLINDGISIAHGGSLNPDECWAILQEQKKYVKSDNFFELAKRIR